MSRFRIEQRKDEPIDITVMRCFMEALEKMPTNTALAAVHWMENKTRDYTTPTQDRDFFLV